MYLLSTLGEKIPVQKIIVLPLANKSLGFVLFIALNAFFAFLNLNVEIDHPE